MKVASWLRLGRFVFVLLLPVAAVAEQVEDSLIQYHRESCKKQSLGSILALEGKNLRAAAQQYLFDCVPAKDPALQPNFWRIYQRLRDEKQVYFISYESDLRMAITAILHNGDKQDFENLLKEYSRRSSKHPFSPEAYLPPLSLAWIRFEIEAIKKEPRRRIVLPDLKVPIPPKVSTLSSEMRSLWSSYRQLSTTFETLITNSRKLDWKNYYNFSNEFYPTIERFLQGKENNAFTKISQFRNTSRCGHGSERWQAPRYWTQVMALLKERNIAAALGALFARPHFGFNVWDPKDPFDWHRDLLAAANLDWEDYFIGAVLNGRLEYLKDLGQYGSEKSARRLVMLDGFIDPNDYYAPEYLKALATYVRPGCTVGHGNIAYDSEFRLRSDIVISEQIEQRLLQALGSQIQTDHRRDYLEGATYALLRLCRPESKDVLRRALEIPRHKVQQMAQKTLAALGEDIQIDPSPEQVAFRILANGNPLRSQTIKWDIGKDPYDSWQRSETQSDENGTIMLQHDDISYGRYLALSSPNLSHLSDLVFFKRISLPANLERLHNVQFATSTLTLKLSSKHRKLDSNQMLRIDLARKTSRSADASYYTSLTNYDKITAPVSSLIQFPQVAEGDYEIILDVPGHKYWIKDKVQMAGQDLQIDVQLEPGTDLSFQVTAPGGEARNTRPYFELWRNYGKTKLPVSQSHNYENNIVRFHGLPVGRYELVIYSSTHEYNQPRVNSIPGWGKEILPSRPSDPLHPEFRGTTVPLEITYDSPPLVDLGEIVLSSLP